jgi:peptidoglycan/LPS O-acetylase OafA/YrhL
MGTLLLQPYLIAVLIASSITYFLVEQPVIRFVASAHSFLRIREAKEGATATRY